MKTIKLLAAVLLLALAVSCDTYYRLVTTLDGNGNALREVYAHADSAFWAGDAKSNPFLFEPDSSWIVTRLDTALKYDFWGSNYTLNVKVSKHTSSIGAFSSDLGSDQKRSPLAAPRENLTKKFRWFYTYFSFKGVYKRAVLNEPISIDKYLTREEQRLWTQGDYSMYASLNGTELNDLLDDIEGRFADWYFRNLFDIGISSVAKVANKTIPETDRDMMSKKLDKKASLIDITPELICTTLDAYYQTARFTELLKKEKFAIEHEFELATEEVGKLGNTISYELLVPGELLSTNSNTLSKNAIRWKINGMRIIFSDYELMAEYRVANTWAFLISGLIVLAAIVLALVRLSRRRTLMS